MDELFDLDRLDDNDPFEIDRQQAHLLKHYPQGVDDIYEIWASGPLFYPAKPPAHWLMVAEISGHVLMVPLAPSDHDDPRSVGPSAATSLPNISLTDTRRTDDQEDDSPARTRLLRRPGQPDPARPGPPTNYEAH